MSILSFLQGEAQGAVNHITGGVSDLAKWLPNTGLAKFAAPTGIGGSFLNNAGQGVFNTAKDAIRAPIVFGGSLTAYNQNPNAGYGAAYNRAQSQIPNYNFDLASRISQASPNSAVRTAGTVGNLAGQTLSYLAAPQLGARTLLGRAALGATEFAGYNALQSAGEGQNAQQTLEAIKQGALTGSISKLVPGLNPIKNIGKVPLLSAVPRLAANAAGGYIAGRATGQDNNEALQTALLSGLNTGPASKTLPNTLKTVEQYAHARGFSDLQLTHEAPIPHVPTDNTINGVKVNDYSQATPTKPIDTVTRKITQKDLLNNKMFGTPVPKGVIAVSAGDKGVVNATFDKNGNIISWNANDPAFEKKYGDPSVTGQDFVNKGVVTPKELSLAKASKENINTPTNDLSLEGAQFRSLPSASDIGRNNVPIQAELPPNRGTGSDLKEKSFLKGAETSPDLSLETRSLVQESDSTYTPRKNAELAATASAQVDAMGMDVAKQNALNATDITDEGVARAIEVAKRLDAAGMSGEANQVIQANADRALQAGRAVQANRLLARYSAQGVKAQLAQLALKAGRTLEDGTVVPAKVSDETFNTVAQMMTEAVKLPEGRERNLAIQKTQEYIRDQFPSNIVDQALSVWQAGLLTGFKTSGLNLAANAGHAVLRKVSDLPSTLVDVATSLFTGKRTISLTTKGLGRGVSQGSKEAIDYLVNGYDPAKVGNKFEGGTVFSNNAVGKLAKIYTQTIQRFIGSQDRPFSKAAFFNSIADQAGAEAKNLSLHGDEYSQYVDKMLANPSPKIGKRAAKEAEQAVFANSTQLGTAAQKITQSVPGSKALIPFAKTPSAVVGSVFSYTPIGTVYEIGKQIAAKTFDQRALSQAIGKGLTGTALLWLGTELAKGGYINGSYPTDPKERALWLAENRQENSIVFPNGVQIQAQSLGPAGNVLVAGAAMQKAKDNGTGELAALGAQIGSTALQSPALQGLQGFTDALNDPTRNAQSFANSLAGSIVPTLVSDVAQAGDRAPNGQGVARQTNSTLDSITNRLPGLHLRESNPVAVDSLGNDRTTGKNLFQTLIDPTRSVTLNSSPAIDTLRSLSNQGASATPTKQDRKITAHGYDLTLTPSQLTDLQKKEGLATQQAIQAISNNPAFQASSPEDQAAYIDKIASGIRSQVRENFVTSLDQASLTEAQAKSTGKTTVIPVTQPKSLSSKGTFSPGTFSGKIASIKGSGRGKVARLPRPAPIKVAKIYQGGKTKSLTTSNGARLSAPKLPAIKRISAPRAKKSSLGKIASTRAPRSLRRKA